MLSRNLEKTLHRALAYANERRHEYATLEHLLLALTEDQDAIAVLRACTVDLDKLRRERPHLCRQRARQSRLQPCRGREADRELPARAAARRDPRPVLGPRGSDRRQRAGRDVRRARKPRRLFPAGAGHDALRRGQLHLARHRQGAGPLRDAPRPGRRRGRASAARRAARSAATTRSTPIASTSTRRRATARSIR